MTTSLASIKERLVAREIHFSDDSPTGQPTTVGYDKRFRWRWVATQLNTFIVASDLGDTPIDEATLERYLADAFEYAQRNYKGWPRGLQSGIGVITILLSSNLTADAISYCEDSRSGKKWAGFTIPVLVNRATGQTHRFTSKPMWGRIYYPFFEELIDDVTR